MFRHFLLAAICLVIFDSKTANADSSVMHQQIDIMRQQCIDQGGQFEYPKCYLPEDEGSTSSDGSDAAAAGIVIIGAVCLFSFLADKGPCA